jgi:hypothetical protein
MYDYTVIHVARQEEERRRQQAEIIATVYGGYAPMPKKPVRTWLMTRFNMLRGQTVPPVRIDAQTPFTQAEMDAANMAGD